jgi:hypothetical protein
VAFLLREKIIERSAVDLNNNLTYVHLDKSDDIQLQRMADFIVNKVRVHLQPQSEEEYSLCEYI